MDIMVTLDPRFNPVAGESGYKPDGIPKPSEWRECQSRAIAHLDSNFSRFGLTKDEWENSAKPAIQAAEYAGVCG